MRLKVFCKIKENAHGYFNQARANFCARHRRNDFRGAPEIFRAQALPPLEASR
jgi:hypothetical protein